MFFYLLPFIILITILVAVYILPEIVDFGKSSMSSFESFITSFWKENESISGGEYYRLATASFLHSDVYQLLYSIFGIFIFRYVLDDLILKGYTQPSLIYLGIFLLAGVIGNLTSYIFNPESSLGANGAIFGFVGYLLTSSFDLNILFYVVISFAFATIPGSRIDIYSQLGGLLAGIVVAIII
jgi:rhomboid protease GluP